MSNLFLIGNGFDLSCGIKSSYIDIYKGYIKTASSNKTIQTFKENISADFQTWGDFEIAMGHYANNVTSAEEYISCIRDFRQYLADYLESQQSSFFSSIHNNSFILNSIRDEIKKSINNFYIGCSHNCENSVRRNNSSYGSSTDFITFNYTTIADSLISLISQDQTSLKLNTYHSGFFTTHIHGSLEENDLVMGVDNDSQIIAHFTINQTIKRLFIKPLFNNDYDQSRIERTNQLIMHASNICVYGMSLGDSDITWRKMLFDWLSSDSSKQLFIYDYATSTKTIRFVEEKMEFENNKKAELLKKWNITLDTEISERLHIPCGKNIFNITDAINKGKADYIDYQKKKPHIV